MARLRVVAVLALVGIGAVHLNLYARQNYRYIPTIGALFLFTVIVAFVLAAALAVRAHWTLAVIGAGFALSTLAGYVWSLTDSAGLFEFHEPGISYSGAASIALEAIAGLALLAWVGLDRRHRDRPRTGATLRTRGGTG